MASHDIASETDVEAMAGYRLSWITVNALLRRGHSWSGHERHCSYLNLGGGRMANISSIAGLDYAEDGRGLAVSDWDHDGDWDFWITNRSAPAVRVLENRIGQTSDFIAIRLQGTTCNRDAIGARVTLKGIHPIAMQTLRAGDGFVSQSSKWLRFGLGQAERPTVDVEIRWPDGTTQIREKLAINQHHLVIQDRNVVSPLTFKGRPTFQDQPVFEPLPTPSRSRLVAYSRLPFPKMQLEDWSGARIALGESRQGPFLVNLWGSWCRPCLQELGELASRYEELRSAGLRIEALTTDLLDPEIGSEVAARRAAEKLSLPFRLLWADNDAIASLEALQRVLLDEQTPLPLPSSFLVDAQGQVAVLYRGPVTASQVLADLALLPQSGARLNQSAAPFKGTRNASPSKIDPIQVALKLYENGDTALARSYLGQLIEIAETRSPGHEGMKADALHYFMGTLLEEAGFPDRSVTAYQFALRHNPQHAPARRNLARHRLRQGKIDEALPHLQQAVQALPHDPNLQFHWLSALYQSRRTSEAISGLQEHLQRHPQDRRAMRLLSWIYATSPNAEHRDGTAALRLAQASLEGEQSTSAEGADILAAALAEMKRFDEAVEVVDAALATLQSPAAANPAQARRWETMHQYRAAYAAKRPWRER